MAKDKEYVIESKGFDHVAISRERYKIELEDLMKKDKDPCVICGGEIADDWGHNPEPVKEYNEGKCCDTCNFTVVIPARIKLAYQQ